MANIHYCSICKKDLPNPYFIPGAFITCLYPNEHKDSFADTGISSDDFNVLLPYEERIKPLTDRLDNMTIELESQTTELQKLRYENTKLNAQIEVLNVTNDKQLAEISDLKANDIVSKNTIQTLNDTVSNMTSKSKLNAIIGILFAIIEGIAVWYIMTKLLS